MLEQELTIKMEKLKAETEWEHLNLEKECVNFDEECMKFKVDILCQRFQLLREGVSQDDIDSVSPIAHD